MATKTNLRHKVKTNNNKWNNFNKVAKVIFKQSFKSNTIKHLIILLYSLILRNFNLHVKKE